MAIQRKIRQRRKKAGNKITWGKIRVIVTILFIAWVSLAANGLLPASDGSVVTMAHEASVISTTNLYAPTPGMKAVREKPKAELPAPVTGVVGPIRSIPDELNNYRCLGVTPDQLRKFFATSGTTRLMNLSGDIPGKISTAEVRAICVEFNVEYLITGDLNRFAARSGYQEGRGFVRSAAAAARYLAGGNVLVIDRSGNRSGALVGAYLISVHGFTVEQAIMHNNWEKFARNPDKSYKYLETVTGAVTTNTDQ